MSTHDTHTQYKLRMPPELRDKLKAASMDSHRSMNAEIVARLQESFARESGNENLRLVYDYDDPNLAELNERLQGHVEQMLADLASANIRLQRRFGKHGSVKESDDDSGGSEDH